MVTFILLFFVFLMIILSVIIILSIVAVVEIISVSLIVFAIISRIIIVIMEMLAGAADMAAATAGGTGAGMVAVTVMVVTNAEFAAWSDAHALGLNSSIDRSIISGDLRLLSRGSAHLLFSIAVSEI